MSSKSRAMPIDYFGPKYACGNSPEVGDLIEFGTRHKRLIVTEIDAEGPETVLWCGRRQYGEQSMPLMVLIERHNAPRTRAGSWF
tara:strand:- start:1922 stop:2176 length:255 start_codon:yes stop_codon:yes gene_type:complete